jgi:hypothetical protein
MCSAYINFVTVTAFSIINYRAMFLKPTYFWLFCTLKLSYTFESQSVLEKYNICYVEQFADKTTEACRRAPRRVLSCNESVSDISIGAKFHF